MIHYSTTTINRVFDKSSLRPSAAGQPGTVTVPGFMGGTFVFDKKTLQREAYHIILYLLKHLPKEMRRSVSSVGMPWTFVARDTDGVYWMSFQTADRLACMAIALELMTRQSSPSPDVTDMDCIVIEDLRQRKMEAINPTCKRNNKRKSWENASNVKNRA